jgi:hypothetical protein
VPTARPTSLPFASLNLLRNPFGEVPFSEWAALAVTDLEIDSIARRLSRPGYALEIAGGQGHGKTTHMRVLHARFLETPFVLVEADGGWSVVGGQAQRSRFGALPSAPLLFVDEVDRLPARARRRLLRRRASFVLGTHGRHGPELEAAGLEWRRVEMGALGRSTLRRIVDRRIEGARRDTGPLPGIDDAVLDGLLAAHGQDVRSMFEALYDIFEARRAAADGRLQPLDRAR